MEFFKKVWETIKPHYIWFATGLVVLLYIGSYALHYYDVAYWPSVLSQAAATVIAGGIFASLLKSYQYSELFKSELENLFADDRFVSKMKHIARHGIDDKQTMRNTFEHLATRSSPSLGERVAPSFSSMLEVKTDYTLRNYKRYIKITGYSKTKGTITIEDEVQYEVVVHEDSHYKSEAGGAGLAGSPQIKEFTLIEINNGEPSVDLSKTVILAGGVMTISSPVTRGRAYRLHRNLGICYQLFKDPNIHQQFSRICDGFELEIDNQVATDIQLTMTWVNYEKDPASTPRDEGGRTVCRYTEHGLTFPFQGFILTMCPNK